MFNKNIRYGRKIDKIENKIMYCRDISMYSPISILFPDKYDKKILKLEYKKRKYQNKLKETNSYIFKS